MRKPYSYTEIDRIVRLRMKGIRPEHIAEVLDRNKGAIDKLLSVEKNKRGIEYPKLRKSNTVHTDYAIEMIARKTRTMTYAEIGMEKGISAPRIFGLLKQRAKRLHEGTWAG